MNHAHQPPTCPLAGSDTHTDRGVLTKENLSCCHYVGRVRVRVGVYAYLGENPKFLNETAAQAAARIGSPPLHTDYQAMITTRLLQAHPHPMAAAD